MPALSMHAHSNLAELPPAARLGRFRLAPDNRAEAALQRRRKRALEAAIAADNFELQFQPNLSLRHGGVTVVEAQLRWPQGKGGLLPAAMFLPLAEQTGQIVRIGGWALRHACSAVIAANWPATWSVSVTVSLRQIEEGVLLAQVADALEHSQLAPDRLEIALAEPDVTEISLESLLTLSALRDLGLGLALDAFGTGAASFACLRRLPLTQLRLDRSLIRDVPDNHEDSAIVRAIVQTGHALGLRVAASGIETEQQRGFLAASGCDDGQGPLFSQPLPAHQIRQRMKKP